MNNKIDTQLQPFGATNETVTNCHGLKMPAADGKLRYEQLS
jgi:hypothetical protein